MPAADLILGRYEPLAEVGRGASGRVVHALDTKLKRDVAIKCIHIPRTTACEPSAACGSELPHGGSTRASAAEFSGNEIMPENYLAPANVFAPHEEAPTSVSSSQLGSVSEAERTPSTPSASLTELGLEGGEQASPSPVQAALEEARTTAKLKAANIVTVYDFALSGDMAYVVMEYVDGVTLADVLAQLDDDITLDVVAAVVKGVGAALNAAHKQGVLHLDIKPQNVLIDTSGQVKVADFGMSALMDAAGVGHTAGGTVGYMPPEQLRLGELDARSDEWALASLAYEMLVGENPFKTDDLARAASKIEGAELVVPSLCWEDSDPFIDDVIFAALDPRPDSRYDTVADFVTELMPLLGSPKNGKAQLASAVADGMKAAEVSSDIPPFESAECMPDHAANNDGARIIPGVQASFDFDPDFDADGDFDPAVVATFADSDSSPAACVASPSPKKSCGVAKRVIKRVVCAMAVFVAMVLCLLNVHIGGLLDVAPASEVTGVAYGLFSDLPIVAWVVSIAFAVIAAFAPIYASIAVMAALCAVCALNACFVNPMPYATILAWVVQGVFFVAAMRSAKKFHRRGFAFWIYGVVAILAVVAQYVVPLHWPALSSMQAKPAALVINMVAMLAMLACAL